MDVDVLNREAVERTASIFGATSAVAQALRCVEVDHDGKAEVCRPVGENRLIVVPHADLIEAGWSA